MDVFGEALMDYEKRGKSFILWLYNSYDGPEEMPVDIFFRTEEEMPDIEHKAMELCYGKTLDVGAGAGAHSLLLQEMGIDVTAMDSSAGAVSVMKKRGVKKVLHQDVNSINEKYDTLLFMMNGIGLTGSLPGFIDFLEKAKKLINPNGQLIFDSSDISYLYDFLPKPKNQYFGEVNYLYKYKQQKGEWFSWLYLDRETMLATAKQCGWQCSIVADDGEDHFLVRLVL